MIVSNTSRDTAMNVPAYNVIHALRRFVGLRSAWRRSLAMEPRDGLPPSVGPGGEEPCATARREPGCSPCSCHA